VGRGNTRARNAKNGRFVTKADVKKHLDTTVVETISGDSVGVGINKQLSSVTSTGFFAAIRSIILS